MTGISLTTTLECQIMKTSRQIYALVLFAVLAAYVLYLRHNAEISGDVSRAVADHVGTPSANSRRVAADDPVGVSDAPSTSDVKPLSVYAPTLGSPSLKWKSLVGERSTDWAIRQLVVSSNPDDWYRAVALARVCVATASIPEDAMITVLKTTTLPSSRHPDVAAVLAQARVQCGANDTEWLGNELMTNLLQKAKQGGSTLATAPQLSSQSLRDGFSQVEANALGAVLRDQGLRSAWLLVNADRLARAVADMPNNVGVKTSEVVAAIFQGMCQAGDECGAGTIYSPALCYASSYELCSADGINQALSTNGSSERSLRISSFSAQITEAMNKSDLSMLGIRINK